LIFIQAVATPAFVLLLVAAVAVLILRDWRLVLAALAVQYIGVFLLTAEAWPVGLAIIKLVVGWMATAVLGLTQLSHIETVEEHSWPSGWLFRLLASLLVLLVVISTAPSLVLWLPVNVSLPAAQGSLALIGMGMLQLGMTTRPLRVIGGLLTFLAGFEILFASVENSLLVAGLLAIVNLSLAFIGAYLLTPAAEEPTP
jgi:hypothetical protein